MKDTYRSGVFCPKCSIDCSNPWSVSISLFLTIPNRLVRLGEGERMMESYLFPCSIQLLELEREKTFEWV